MNSIDKRNTWKRKMFVDTAENVMYLPWVRAVTVSFMEMGTQNVWVDGSEAGDERGRRELKRWSDFLVA